MEYKISLTKTRIVFLTVFMLSLVAASSYISSDFAAPFYINSSQGISEVNVNTPLVSSENFTGEWFIGDLVASQIQSGSGDITLNPAGDIDLNGNTVKDAPNLLNTSKCSTTEVYVWGYGCINNESVGTDTFSDTAWIDSGNNITSNISVNNGDVQIAGSLYANTINADQLKLPDSPNNTDYNKENITVNDPSVDEFKISGAGLNPEQIFMENGRNITLKESGGTARTWIYSDIANSDARMELRLEEDKALLEFFGNDSSGGNIRMEGDSMTIYNNEGNTTFDVDQTERLRFPVYNSKRIYTWGQPLKGVPGLGVEGGDTINYSNQDGTAVNLDVSGQIQINDQADNQSIEVQEQDKICLDGNTCSHHMYYNGSGVVIK